MVSITAERIDDVSVIWFDNPPVNALGSELRIGIAEAVKVAGEQDVAGIVLASRNAMFSAGADIKEFNQTPIHPSLREVIAVLEGSAKPVVAAINGVCFGGGLELALA